MLGFMRVIVLGFIALTVVYFLVSIYSRSLRREKLEDMWAEDHPQGSDPVAREAFIAKGMADYDSSIRPRLVLLVYVIPTILAAILMYVIN